MTLDLQPVIAERGIGPNTDRSDEAGTRDFGCSRVDPVRRQHRGNSIQIGRRKPQLVSSTSTARDDTRDSMCVPGHRHGIGEAEPPPQFRPAPVIATDAVDRSLALRLLLMM